MGVFYESSFGQIVDLENWPIMLQDVEKLLEYQWKYVQSGNEISQFTTGMVTKDCTVSIFAEDEEEFSNTLNSLLEVFEKDVKMKQKGRLVINDYFMECYIYGQSYNEFQDDLYATDITLKIVTPTGVWEREQLFRFRYQEAGQEAENGKAYPYGYPYDYGLDGSFAGVIDNDNYVPSDFVMIIYGYVKCPRITIAGMTYTLKMTIDSGERVIITSKDKEIILIKERDVRSNAFRYRDPRFDIFSKIQPGENRVNWNAQFDFDIWLMQERSEPVWS